MIRIASASIAALALALGLGATAASAANYGGGHWQQPYGQLPPQVIYQPHVVTLPFIPPYELWLRHHRHHWPLFAAPRDTFQYQAGPQFRGYGH